MGRWRVRYHVRCGGGGRREPAGGWNRAWGVPPRLGACRRDVRPRRTGTRDCQRPNWIPYHRPVSIIVCPQQPLDIGARQFRLDALEGIDALLDVRLNGAALGKIRLTLRADLRLGAPEHVLGRPVCAPGGGIGGGGARERGSELIGHGRRAPGWKGDGGAGGGRRAMQASPPTACGFCMEWARVVIGGMR